MDNIKNTVNTNLRYQVQLGKDDFRILTKNYSPTHYSKYVFVDISVLDPLDLFPRPDKNHVPVVEESHAKMIADTVDRAKENARRQKDSEWKNGKRILSPQKVERNLRTKLDSPQKINSVLQGIIQGKKVIDLEELGIRETTGESEEVEVEVDMNAAPFIPLPGT